MKGEEEMLRRILLLVAVMNFISLVVAAPGSGDPIRRLPADKIGTSSREDHPVSSPGSARQEAIKSEEEPDGGPNSGGLRRQTMGNIPASQLANTGQRGIIIIDGKVTSITGNEVSITDNRGLQRRFKVDSTAGIKIGMGASCDGDCGRTLKIGSSSVRVLKIK